VSYDPTPDVTIRRAVMAMHWDQLTFLHWPYPAEVIAATLPRGLEVDTFDGQAWVSLVPFAMRVTLPGLGTPRWPCRFPETNVRTYVRGADGTRGIWFYSLDADRLSAVCAARAAFGLPYMRADMTVTGGDGELGYDCRRQRPHAPAGSRVRVRIGDPIAAADLTDRDHFLSARWRLYSRWCGRVVSARALHEPWPLHTAELLELDDSLVVADGLPAPQGDPIVQYAPTVTVRVSRPSVLRMR
jgi:uncharacterized protein YqjF (DUF2071 family)